MTEGRAQILVVEDEGLIRQGEVMLLEEAGYEVLEAGTADQAITILEANPDVRVVVTDVHMPGTMDGLKLTHHVRDRWPPIALIVITGEPADLWSLVPAGTMFCSKPIMEQLLLSSVGVALAEALGRSSGGLASSPAI